MGYSLWGHKESDTTERLTCTHIIIPNVMSERIISHSSSHDDNECALQLRWFPSFIIFHIILVTLIA